MSGPKATRHRRAIDGGEAGSAHGRWTQETTISDWTGSKFSFSTNPGRRNRIPIWTNSRERVVSHGMINLLQLAGTPTKDGVFRLDTSLEDSVTFKDDFKGKHGNWYPLPVVGEETDALGLAYGPVRFEQRHRDYPLGGPLARTRSHHWQKPR